MQLTSFYENRIAGEQIHNLSCVWATFENILLIKDGRQSRRLMLQGEKRKEVGEGRSDCVFSKRQRCRCV